mgnify:CR=1 FL=1
MKTIIIFVLLNTYTMFSETTNHSPKADVISPYSVGIKPFAVGDDLLNTICGIYKITSPTNKIYIGQTTNYKKRIKMYRSLSCKSQIKLYHSLKKYDFEDHKFEIIHECPPEQLNELEKHYVDLFQTFNSRQGMNLRDGGGSHGKMSDETKIKMRLKLLGNRRMIGKNLSSITRAKLSLAMLGNANHFFGKSHSIETKIKIANANRGNKYMLGKKHSQKTINKLKFYANNRSQDHKDKIGKANKGKTISIETRKKMSLAHSGNKNHFFGKTHSSETKLKISLAGIGRVAWNKGLKKNNNA